MRFSNPELDALYDERELSFDVETTGLRPFHGDVAFAAVLSTDKKSCYVDLTDPAALAELIEFIRVRPRTYYQHNAKFDMHFARLCGIEFPWECDIVCTAALARVVNSDLEGGYSLANCGKHYLNDEKFDTVKKYVEDNELYNYVEVDGLAKRVRYDHYDRVPREIMEPYARQDGYLTYKLGQCLRDRLLLQIAGDRKIKADVAINERQLTKTCWDMEQKGVLLDMNFVRKAMAHEQAKFEEATQAFAKETGRDYVASAKAFTEAFEAVGYSTASLDRTDKGNIRFDHKALAGIGNDAAKFALAAKDAKSRANFYAGFAYHADVQSLIHTSFRQYGTKTGRFSSAEPNLQNLSRPDMDEEVQLEEFPVRRAIIPYSSDYCLVMLDFAQQEFRMMLDYAGQMDLIEEIKAGKDVHSATAQLVGIERYKAKTLNFALLYGAGARRVSEMLGITEDEARELIRKFYAALPKVEDLIRQVRYVAKYRGYIVNWFGRRIEYPDRGKAYAAPNHLIQGGAADVIRIAMNRSAALLAPTRSHLCLTIHDELVFNMHKNELDLVPEIQRIMETVYPYKHLPLPVDVSHSWKSLADKVKGLPVVENVG